MKLNYFLFMCMCSGIAAFPLDNNNEYEILNRAIRSPTFKKKPLAFLLGGGGGGNGGGGHGGGYGGGNYVTNINNYGPYHETSHTPHGSSGYHEHGGESYAGSAAVAGGHGGNSQAQSQSASFSLGPYSASFSQSQAQGGGRYFDY